MILNMSYGASQAQIIPFTVSNETGIYSTPFTVNNVKIPSGKVKGFCIQRCFEETNTITRGYIYEICRNEAFDEVTQGNIFAVYYGLQTYSIYNDITENDFEYNAANETFSFKVRFYNADPLNYAYLTPGNYQLVIW